MNNEGINNNENKNNFYDLSITNKKDEINHLEIYKKKNIEKNETKIKKSSKLVHKISDIPLFDKKEESEKNKIENEDKNEKDDNDEMHLSSSYSNNDSREVYKRENQRDNNSEIGRVRGRGERGRRVIRSRGNRGRARRYY